MLDNKSKSKKSSSSNQQDVKHGGVNIYQAERELVSCLIENTHHDTSVRSFSTNALTLLNQHPVLKDNSVVIWKCNSDLISIIVADNMDFEGEKELKKSLTEINKYQPLKINYVSLRHHVTDAVITRLDICLGKKDSESFFFSFWSGASELDLKLLSPFFKDFFGVFSLYLLNLLNRKQVKLLKTILEKALDSVEITDEEAVIQYVNPAFEQITLYQSAEAINKTVASLLRSPKEDKRLFEYMKQELDAGNIWRGQINSRKKDGSDWIAQTIIVPITDDDSGKITQHIAIKQDITEQVNFVNQLKISEERYRNLMNAASDAIFIHDLNGLFLEVNTAACKSLGYSPDELRKSYVWDIEIGASQAVLNQMWVDLQNGPISLEGRHRRKDGTTFPVDVHLGIFNATGEKLVLAIAQDISAQKRSQATIRQLTRALEQSPILVLITDKAGIIEYVNAKVLEQTGYRPEEILGQNSRILQSGQTPIETYKLLWNQLTHGYEWRGELLNKNKKGELFWVSAIISPLRNDADEITHYLAVMEDISQKKSYEEMLKHQATYDNLTNLPNRFYGFNKLEHAIARAHANKQKLAVLFLDLDEFKQINDSLGHAAGDLLLKALSERYLSVIRQTDTIARLGGDEFMMILEHIHSLYDAELIAKKCHDVCLQPFLIESQDLLVSSSIGIALYPDHGKDAKTLMRNADTAMYQSKINKNEWTVFTHSMAEVASNRLRIKAELQMALNREELYLCYQPIMDIKNNKIVAAEALLRWQSATLGHVMPDQIIPTAEESGLIVHLGYWILKKACLQAKEWQLVTCNDLKIAVNISTLQLKQKDFVSKVKLILKKVGISPESLIFEITESAFIDDSKFILSQLNQLNDMNIHCSLDDFGIGYSSLNSLRSYPFKSLKIDRAFIQGINTNSNDLSLVNSIIAMSKNLKLTVVAEGIETGEQLDLMRSMNCDMAQGWYFSEAMTSDQFFIYLTNQFKGN